MEGTDRMVKKIVLWALVIGCMAMIFSFSAQPATDSMNLSDGLLNGILRFLHISLPVSTVTFMRTFIRKVAHFAVYMLLGLEVYVLFKIGYGLKTKKSAGITAVVCALYSVSDEIHQIFVPGRSGMIKDVLIDTSGALCGMAAALLICAALSRRKKNG